MSNWVEIDDGCYVNFDHYIRIEISETDYDNGDPAAKIFGIKTTKIDGTEEILSLGSKNFLIDHLKELMRKAKQ